MPRPKVDRQRMNDVLIGIMLEGKLLKDLAIINSTIELTRGDTPPRLYVRQPIPSFEDVPHEVMADCEIAELHQNRQEDRGKIIKLMQERGLEVVPIKDTRKNKSASTTIYRLPSSDYLVSATNQNA